jgi:G3E family GTPase
VQVTLVTGFLGAGKSTLVSYVLSAQHGRRIAVVVNEFGAGLGLERALVRDGDRHDHATCLVHLRASLCLVR